MNKFSIIIPIIILPILALFLFNSKNDSDRITNYPPQNTTIVAFGDSLVEGVGAVNGSDFVTKLSDLLDREIINLGNSGDTTEDGVQRLESLLETQPGVAIILLGGNDYIKKIPQAETEDNLRLIVRELQGQGTVVVLVGVRGGLLKDQRGDMYKDLSDELGAVFVDDVLDGIFAHPDLMSDAIHPNGTGYTAIAEKIYKEIKFLFE